MLSTKIITLLKDTIKAAPWRAQSLPMWPSELSWLYILIRACFIAMCNLQVLMKRDTVKV